MPFRTVFLVSSGPKHEGTLLGSTAAYCTNGTRSKNFDPQKKKVRQVLENLDDRIFVLIREGGTLKQVLSQLLNDFCSFRVLIAAHYGGADHATANHVRQLVAGRRNVICFKPFHHADFDPVWSEIRDFLSFLLQAERDTEYSQHFDHLWNALAPTKGESADHLRSLILEPFAALDLITQFENEMGTVSDEMELCRGDAMERIDAATEYSDMVNELSLLLGLDDLTGELISCIEDPEDSSWTISHRKFQELAIKIEEKITLLDQERE